MFGEYEHIFWGIVASSATGLATAVGALPVLLPIKRISDKFLDAMLGFAAGVMLAATAFSLLIPAIELSSVWTASMGIIIGAALLAAMDHIIPHIHFISGPEGPKSNLRRIWLLMLAITLHNFPEGLSVGIAFGGKDYKTATALSLAIGLQNMPEGLAVALPLLREGYGQWRALFYAFLSGVAEPIAGAIGVIAVTFMQPLYPFGLAFAAGAMLYVVSEEMIPETHRHGYEKVGTWGIVIGFIIMMILDNLF